MLLPDHYQALPSDLDLKTASRSLMLSLLIISDLCIPFCLISQGQFLETEVSNSTKLHLGLRRSAAPCTALQFTMYASKEHYGFPLFYVFQLQHPPNSDHRHHR